MPSGEPPVRGSGRKPRRRAPQMPWQSVPGLGDVVGKTLPTLGATHDESRGPADIFKQRSPHGSRGYPGPGEGPKQAIRSAPPSPEGTGGPPRYAQGGPPYEYPRRPRRRRD